MNSCSSGEPKSIFLHGKWYRFSSYADREEFIRDLSDEDRRSVSARTGEYIA